MKIIFKIFTLTLITLLLNIQTITAQCHIDDWTALKALYESTDGDNWINRAGWDVMIDNLISPPATCSLSTLYGISTNNGRVTCIDLDSEDNCSWSPAGNNLVGSIPIELSNLTYLSSLILSNNQLIGNFPIELQKLNNLNLIYLSNNLLSGPIPSEIENFTNLWFLRLGDNNFTGNIPSEIGSITNLSQLFLENNNLDGSIPTSIGNLNNLSYLILRHNPLTGNIPSTIGDLNNLEALDISNTHISGIPYEIGDLLQLEGLYLQNNSQLNGNIPSQIWNLVNLKELFLGNSNFIGSIPPEIGNLTQLVVFEIKENQLSGIIPASFSNLTQLKSFSCWENNLEGEVLDIIINFPNLEFFIASYNQFTGTIPTSINNLTQLRQMDLYQNNFSGVLPSQLGGLSQLYDITLAQNQFEDCYPNSISSFCSFQNTSQNYWMSDGNNFDATWEDFCATGAGICDDSCPPNCPIEVNDVYPGDLNHDGIVNRVDVGLLGLYHFEIGPERTEEHQNTDWYAHPATDWNRQHLNSADIKHFNTNGDNVIDDLDHQAVFENMDSIWTNPIPLPAPEQSDYQVMLQPANQVIDGFLLIDVSLERRTGGNLNIQGGHFTIDYSDIDGTISQATLNLNPTPWIGIPGINLTYESKTFIEEKKIEVGFTRSDNAISEGEGIIGRLILQFDNGTSKRRANQVYEFCVNTIGTHNGVDYTLIEDQNLQVDVIGGDCQSNLTISENTPFQNEYKSSNSIETDDFILIGANQKVEYKASDRITLNSGFRVKIGAEFTAEIEPCE